MAGLISRSFNLCFGYKSVNIFRTKLQTWNCAWSVDNLYAGKEKTVLLLSCAALSSRLDKENILVSTRLQYVHQIN